MSSPPRMAGAALALLWLGVALPAAGQAPAMEPPAMEPSAAEPPATEPAPDPTERIAGARDPYAQRVRLGLFPAYFQGGISQSHFGSAARVGVDLMPGLSLSARGRVRWPVTTGEKNGRASVVGGTLLWHVVDREKMTQAGGTLYPEDVPLSANADATATASGSDQDVPVSQRLGGPRMTMREVDRDAMVPVRSVHTIRLGYDFALAVQGIDGGQDLRMENRMHLLRVGYGFGDHWNLGAQALGQRELGHRHFFAEAMLSLPALVDYRAVDETGRMAKAAGVDPAFLALGFRLGLEGAMDALISGADGVGLAYQLEIGSFPGYSGLEGYLMIALGLELDP